MTVPVCCGWSGADDDEVGICEEVDGLVVVMKVDKVAWDDELVVDEPPPDATEPTTQ